MSKPDKEFKGPFWTKRGIDAEVAKRRGYGFWEDGNPEEVRETYRDYGLKGGVLGTLTRWAKGDEDTGKPGHGLLIVRHRVHPRYKKIVPEMRPTDPIVTDTTRHYHGFLPYDPEADYNIVDGEHRPLPDNHVHGAHTALQHRLKHHSGLSDDEYREHIRRRDHEGLRLEDLEAQGIVGNCEAPHEHDHGAKYLFPPSGTVEEPFSHDHDEDFSWEPTNHQVLLYAVLRNPWSWIIAPVKQEPEGKIRRDTKLRVAARLMASVKRSIDNQIKRRDKHLEKYHEDVVPPTKNQVLLYAVVQSSWPWLITPAKRDPDPKIKRDTKLRVAERLLASVKRSIDTQTKLRDKHFEKYPENEVPDVIGEHYHGPWYHRHDSYGTDAAKLERHARHWHHNKAPARLERKHRHCFKAKDREQNHAKRLDVHPMAQERLKRAGVVFFPIEGCLKADALLSAVLREGWNASVISVPSVSLWLTPELEDPEFIETLYGKVVVIIPDADWYEKGQVITQALLAHSYLVDRDVTTLVAAPHRELYRANHDIKGIDDYLGADYKLDDLQVVEKLPPKAMADFAETGDKAALRSSGLAHYLMAPTKDGRIPRKDGMRTRAKVLCGLARHTGAGGRFHASYGMLERIVKVNHDSLWETVQGLKATKALTANNELIARENFRTGSLEWVEETVITLTDEDGLRGEETTATLAERLAEIRRKAAVTPKRYINTVETLH
jgi:hypothetical protein